MTELEKAIYEILLESKNNSELMLDNIVSIEIVEKAAFDVIQAYMRAETLEKGCCHDPFELNQSHALVTVIATQIVNRVKQLAKEKI